MSTSKYFLKSVMSTIEYNKEKYKEYDLEFSKIDSKYIRDILDSKEQFLQDRIESIVKSINSKFSIYDNGLCINTHIIKKYLKEEITKKPLLDYIDTLYNMVIELYEDNLILYSEKTSTLQQTSSKDFYIQQIFNIYCMTKGLNFISFECSNMSLVPYCQKYVSISNSGYVQITAEKDVIKIEDRVIE